jgi:hypothetical protein
VRSVSFVLEYRPELRRLSGDDVVLGLCLQGCGGVLRVLWMVAGWIWLVFPSWRWLPMESLDPGSEEPGVYSRPMLYQWRFHPDLGVGCPLRLSSKLRRDGVPPDLG